MDPGIIADMGRHTLWVLFWVSVPLLSVALIVGLLISLVQAMTQIQEMTLSFLPKMLAILASLALMMPMILDRLIRLMQEIARHIIHQ